MGVFLVRGVGLRRRSFWMLTAGRAKQVAFWGLEEGVIM
jgi:hypothetical protein